jgi:hypothetical protein
MARLLQYLVPYEECEANPVKAVELYPIDTSKWYALERDDRRDCFHIWFIVGDICY